MLPTGPVTVGTMNFGGRTPKAEALRIVDRALERVATFFDTANAYNDGESEVILGEALRGRRDRAGVATKVGFRKREGKLEGLSARVVRAAAEESLRRLGVDRIDLYYLHVPDYQTPIEQTLDAVQALLDEGKVATWGVSNYASWQIGDFNVACDARGMPRPAVSQVLYNLLVRQLDLEYFGFTRVHPLHTTVYNPLAGGLLAREVSLGDEIPKGSRFDKNRMYRGRYWTEGLQSLAGQYRALAREAGVDPVVMAYAFCSGTPGVDSVLAGPGTVAHLDAALDGCAARLEPALRARIDELHRAFVGTDVSYAR